MDAWPLSFSIPVFVAATGVIVFAGTLLSRTADRIADETGWGEALMGALFLAAVTSLPDLVATLTAVLDDRPELGMSNVMGSMAANLAFLAVADLTYRKANLEHAAASSSNLIHRVHDHLAGHSPARDDDPGSHALGRPPRQPRASARVSVRLSSYTTRTSESDVDSAVDPIHHRRPSSVVPFDIAAPARPLDSVRILGAAGVGRGILFDVRW